MHLVGPRAQGRTPTAPSIAVDERSRKRFGGRFCSDIAVRLHGPVAGAVNGWLEERLAAHIRSQGAGVLALTEPGAVDGGERWRAALEGLVTRHREASRCWRLRLAKTRSSPRCDQTCLTEVRSGARRYGSRSMARRVVNRALADLYSSELAPYVDLLVLSATAEQAAHLPTFKSGFLTHAWRSRRDAGDQPEAVARRLIDSQLETVGTDVAIVAWRSSGLSSRRCAGSHRSHRFWSATSQHSTLLRQA